MSEHTQPVGSCAKLHDGGQRLSPWMRAVVSLLVLGVALFVILSPRYEPDLQNWAFGTVGAILGYWLKS